MLEAKSWVVAALLGAAMFVGGCSYAGVAATPDGRAVIVRNDNILFGLLRKAFVCQVTPAGLAQCQAAEAP